MAKKFKKSVLDAIPYLDQNVKKKETATSAARADGSKSSQKKFKKSVLDSIPYLEQYTQQDDIGPVGTVGSLSDDIAPIAESKTQDLLSGLKTGLLVGSNYATTGTLTDMTIRQAESMTDDNRSAFTGYLKKGALENGVNSDSVSRAILGTGSDAATDLTAGLLGIGEGAVDSVAGIAPYIQYAQNLQNGVTSLKADKMFRNQLEQGKTAASEFIKKDIVDEQSVAKSLLSGIEAYSGMTSKLQNGGYATIAEMDAAQQKQASILDYYNNQMEADSVLDEKADELIKSGGQLLGTSALAAFGIPADVVIGLTSFGSETENALNNGATLDEAAFSGLVSAGAEILTEKFSGGIKFGGKTLDDAATKWLARNVSGKVGRTLAKLGMDMAGEGLEEVAAGLMSAIGQKMTYMSEAELKELFTAEDAWDSFVGGALMGIGGSVAQNMNAKLSGVDAVTGLTKNEQAVVDKVYQNKIAEAEKDGKVTGKQEKKFYEEAMNELERGEISIETIEEVLGGETYKTYKDTVTHEDSVLEQDKSLREELGKLNEMNPEDMTPEQITRQNEIKSELKELESEVNTIKNESKRTEMQTQISNDVYQKAKDSRLAESYNQRSERSKAYEADLTQYGENQRQTIQKAIDSGILNNTRKTHDFVDLVARVSADKGVAFDFTNNERLKDSVFALEGKNVNGFVTKDGIALNINSSKAINTVVGHEITHVLEGTEFYNELQQAVFDYARTKGELGRRWSSLKELYKDLDADINAELTADLVGDYLFADSDFLARLSTDSRNVFEKVFDEIKYLCRIATAGSDEARKLEKVKKAFEDAYRAETKNTVTEDGVRYAVQKKTLTADSTEQERYELLKDEKINVAQVDAEKLDQIDLDAYNTRKKSAVSPGLRELASRLGILNVDLNNSRIAFPFQFSTRNLNKSLHHQIEYGGTYQDYAKAMTCFNEIVENAIPIEVHPEKKVGTVKENPDLKNVYVLVSAFQDGNNVVPVELEVKEFRERGKSLYMTVMLTKIDLEVVDAGVPSETGDVPHLFSRSTISLQQLFENVNPKDGRFLKYVPDGFLNDEQRQAKQEALRKQEMEYANYSLSSGETTQYGNYNVMGSDVQIQDDIGPVNEAKYGDYNVYGEDIAIAPAQEDIGPVREGLQGDFAPIREDVEKNDTNAAFDVAPEATVSEKERVTPKKEAPKAQDAKTTAKQRREKSKGYTDMWADLIGDTSTWVDLPIGLAYKTRTLRRILRKVVKDANGKPDIAKADAIYDALETKYDHNEALLKRESARLKETFQKLNLNHAEDEYAQMLGELRYNPDTTLTEDVVSDFLKKNKFRINEDKVNKAIKESRKLYDDLLVRVNEVLREQGFKEIPYRQGYFPHFTNPKQNWLQKMLNWKPTNDEIPTSIAGLTEMFKPSRSWQSFNKQRKGDKTDYSLYQGLDTYIHGALDWIYHIEDLQERRSLENLIRYTHSEEGVKQRIDEILNGDYDADEAQNLINAVLDEANNPLGGLVRELMNRTNTLANKKSSMDRAVEDLTSRKVYSVMTNLNNRITANQVVGSLSSAMTNFIPMVQSWHQVSPWYTVRGMGDYIRSVIKDDGMVEKSDFLTNRLMEEEKLYQTGWDKVSDKAGMMMGVVDSITSQTVWRSKYLQNLREGMSERQAIRDADQFAKNLMAGRSRGNAPTIFDAKNPLVKIFTAFQLEVANQYGYMFDDVVKDSKSKARLVKGYATAFLGAYAYNALYSSLVGRDAAFDPIAIIEELMSGLLDDEEEEKDVLMDFGKNIVEEMPFVGGLLGGGRIPMSSAFPYSGYSTPIESMLNDLSKENYENIGKELLKPLYYLAMPVGGGQLKKTIEGLSMFSDEHPIAGSYTDSGNLRFEVEDTPLNRAQAAVFGQWASKNAQEYIDEGLSPLNKAQVEQMVKLGFSADEYRTYTAGISEAGKTTDDNGYQKYLDDNGNVYWYDKDNLTVYDANYNESGTSILDLEKANATAAKVEYISNLPISTEQKNILYKDVANQTLTDKYGFAKYTGTQTNEDGEAVEGNFFYDSKRDIWYDDDYAPISKSEIEDLAPVKERDMSDYDEYDNYEEFDYAQKNPEKYQFLQDNNVSFRSYSKDEKVKDAYDWAYNNQEKYAFLKTLDVSATDYTTSDKQTKSAYNWAYENQDKIPMATAVAGDVVTYRKYTSELEDIKADKDENGKSISNSRKKKVFAYINGLDADLITKAMLWKSEYTSDDRYNSMIFEYVNGLDMTITEKKSILELLGATVDSDGRVKWN